MLTYKPLEKFLTGADCDVVAMTFAEVEQILGVELPPSAHKRNEWWSNNATGHSQAKAWLNAGFETTSLDRKNQTVVFKRVISPNGMHEDAVAFRAGPVAKKPVATIGTKVDRHPALGAMKGTFTIEPGYDLTKPVYTDEEWEEIENEMLTKFDRMFPDGIK